MDTAAILDQAIDLEEQGRFAEALARFEQVLTAEPGNAVARAGALGARAAQACDDGRHEDALALCNEALAASTYDLRALTLRARAYAGLGRNREALADCLRVLSYAPEFAEALAVRGAAFIALGEVKSGVEDLEAAAALKPELKFLPGQALHYAMHICRWDGMAEKLARVLAALEDGRPAIRPFWLLSLPSTPLQQKRAAEIQFRETAPARAAAPPPVARGGKIRLGYFSTDFRAHAISHLVAGMLEAHDRTQFELVGFAMGGASDHVRTRIASSMDRFIDCAGLGDAEVAEAARAQGIHLAVGLNGHTGREPAVFARRAAPVQVNYLGYPGTVGAACYDYIIGDPVLTPFEHRAHFTERIVQLPNCYQPNAFSRYGALTAPSRKEVGLPDHGFVFCCFNDAFKILPDVFALWMDLLRAVPGSVLWLLAPDPAAAQNLKREAGQQGVAPERIVFAPRVAIGAHLARHRAADLFLDTFPYNAHTTASDALWAGLPLVTRRGETFASRVAASILTAAGLADLITDTPEAYRRLALALAREPGRLSEVKARLAARRSTAPLFDTARYTRNIERAYVAMWTRQVSGLPPAEFAVTEAP